MTTPNNLVRRPFKPESSGQKWHLEGTLTPLFDRLTDENPQSAEEFPIKKYLSSDEMRVSIIQEILNLLDTRLGYTRSAYELVDGYETQVWGLPVGYPYFYGISDFSAYSGGNAAGLARMEQEIQEAITVFEPRLRNVRVALSLEQDHHETLVHISADMVTGDVTMPFTFPVHLRHA